MCSHCFEGIGYIHNTEPVIFRFCYKFFRPIHIGVGKVELMNTNSQSCHDVGRERMFMHIMTVIKRVPIEEDVFVDSLALENFGFQIDHGENGRPAYHPKDLLKLFIYGYIDTWMSNNHPAAD